MARLPNTKSWILKLMVLAGRMCVTWGLISSCQSNCTRQEGLPCSLKNSNSACFNDVGKRSVWPAAPRGLQVETYIHTDFGLSLNISWYPPYDDSIIHLEGFDVSFVDAEYPVGMQQCFRLNMSHAHWTIKDREQKIYLDCIHDVKKGIVMEVTSLPCSGCQALKFHYRPPATPADWVAKMNTSTFPQTRMLKVQFLPAPSIYNFKIYTIKVTNITKVRQRIEEVKVSGNNIIPFIFHNITPGKYEIGVQPYDKYRYDPYRCVCKETFKRRDVCPGCVLTTATVTMEIAVAEISSNRPTVTKRTEQGKTVTKNKGLIMGITIGVLSLMIITTVAIFVLRRGKVKADHGNDWLPRKRVLVITSCGDERHKRVAGWFGLFLNGYSCDITYNYSYQTMDINTMRKDIYKAEKVVIVNSKDAFEKFRACKINNSEDEDEFTSSVKMVQERWRDDTSAIENTALVSFPYTEDQHEITELLIEGIHSFKLLQEIREFLCFIHNVKSLPEYLDIDLELDLSDIDTDGTPPVFHPPKPDTGTETITSTVIDDFLEAINSGDRESTAPSLGSTREQRRCALAAMKRESVDALSLFKDDETSVDVDQSLFLINQ